MRSDRPQSLTWRSGSTPDLGGGHVLDPLDLAPEPLVVEEVDKRAVKESLDALGPPPVVDLALGLHARSRWWARSRSPRPRTGTTGCRRSRQACGQGVPRCARTAPSR